MKLKIAIPIIWLPILTIWSFIISITANLQIEEFELYGSIFVYLIVSFLLALQLQLIASNKKEIFLIKFGSVNFLLFFLTISTVNIFLNITRVLSSEISIILSISFLILNTILAEIFTFTNKKFINKKRQWDKTNLSLEELQVRSSIKSSATTFASKNYRKEWKDFLNNAAIGYANQPSILNEITRIKEVVDFSSFFRDDKCITILNNLKNNSNENEIYLILSDIK